MVGRALADLKSPGDRNEGYVNVDIFSGAYKCVNNDLFEITKAQQVLPLNGPWNLEATPRKWEGR